MADREDPRTQQVIGGEWRNDHTITEVMAIRKHISAGCQSSEGLP